MAGKFTRALNRLSATQVDGAKATSNKQLRLADGGGLYLRVSPNGSRRWLFRYTMPGQKPREMGIGAAGKGGVSLKDARDIASQARSQIAQGLDPIDQRQAENEAAQRAKRLDAGRKTLGEYIDLWLPSRTQSLRSPRGVHDFETLVRGSCVDLLDVKLQDIKALDVQQLVLPIWTQRPNKGRRLRAELERLLSHAKQTGQYEGENPALMSLHDAVLLRHPSTDTRMAAVPWGEMPVFAEALRSQAGAGVANLALEFLILSALRSQEVRLARWSEIDRNNKLWRIPAQRMKMRKAHIVVLTPRMEEILDQMAQLRRQDDFIFPGSGADGNLGRKVFKQEMSRIIALNDLLPDSIKQATVHGFRSSFRDWAGSATPFPRELCEEALAHVVGGVEGHYRREQAVEKRRPLMLAWQDYVDGSQGAYGASQTAANVVHLSTR